MLESSAQAIAKKKSTIHHFDSEPGFFAFRTMRKRGGHVPLWFFALCKRKQGRAKDGGIWAVAMQVTGETNRK